MCWLLNFFCRQLVFNANHKILKFYKVVKAYCYKNGQVVPVTKSKEYVNYLTEFANECLRIKTQYDQKKKDDIKCRR